MSKERVKIKICGLSRPVDIAYVNEAKPDYCGFIINVPKSIRNTSPDQVRALCAELIPEVVPVGVFRNAPVETVADLLLDGTIRVAQLHGSEDETYIQKLRSYGNFTIFKAFRAPSGLEGAEAVAQWADSVNASSADLVLLDQGGGGTGKTFEWTLARQVHRPFLLAGGIGPDNITAALESLRPWGVDMSSSVETDGKKDREKILEAVAKVREWNQSHQ